MPTYTPFDVGRNQDGRLEVFRYDGTYASSHTWQVAPNVGWGGWFPGPLTRIVNGRIAVASNADGRLEVFYPGHDGVSHVYQTAPNNGWETAGWSMGFPHDRVDSLFAVTNADGRLEVFRVSGATTTAPRGAIWHIWQTAPNNGWSQPEQINLGTNQVGRGLGCFMGPNGRLELYYTNRADPNTARRLVLTSGGWREAATYTQPHAFTWMDQAVRDNVRVRWMPVQQNNLWYVRRVRNEGQVQSEVTDFPQHATADELRCLYDRWGNEHHFQISGWRGLPGPTSEADARLRWSCYSPSMVPQWHDPNFLADWGTMTGSWRVAVNQDGRLEVFAARGDGTIWHKWQLTPGNPGAGWSGWCQL